MQKDIIKRSFTPWVIFGTIYFIYGYSVWLPWDNWEGRVVHLPGARIELGRRLIIFNKVHRNVEFQLVAFWRDSAEPQVRGRACIRSTA
jgi:hypothetical protein